MKSPENYQSASEEIKSAQENMTGKKNETLVTEEASYESENVLQEKEKLNNDRVKQDVEDKENIGKILREINGDFVGEAKNEEVSKKYTLNVAGDPNKVEDKKAEDNRVLEGERKELPINSERGKELTDALHGVAALFNKLGVKWKLDGAINISLKEIGKGKKVFFRNHRDVDVHVFGNAKGEELSKILSETKFEKAPHGYGAFFKSKELLESKKREDQLEFYKFEKGEPLQSGIHFFKLNENGEPYFEIGDVPIDVHFDAQGERSEITGNDLPKEWQRGGGSIDLKGEPVQLDHPGSMLYFKLSQGRKHDFLDVDFMMENGQLGAEDVRQARSVLEDDQQLAKHADQKEKLAKALKKINEIEKNFETLGKRFSREK